MDMTVVERVVDVTDAAVVLMIDVVALVDTTLMEPLACDNAIVEYGIISLQLVAIAV